MLFEQSELNLYTVDQALAERFPELALTRLIADVKDLDALRRAMAAWRPQVVFHAAAYKHVPLVEEGNAAAALLNNTTDLCILGTGGSSLGAQAVAQLLRDKYTTRELYDWMTPLFGNEPIAWRRIRRGLCKLSELAWSIDPNFRANWAYHRIMQSSLKGIDHKERLMLALALYYRNSSRWRGDKSEIKLLDERERQWARCVGLAANLAFQLSAGRGGNLYHAKLTYHAGNVALMLDEEAAPLRTEAVEKRLQGLGEALRAFAGVVV